MENLSKDIHGHDVTGTMWPARIYLHFNYICPYRGSKHATMHGASFDSRTSTYFVNPPLTMETTRILSSSHYPLQIYGWDVDISPPCDFCAFLPLHLSCPLTLLQLRANSSTQLL